MDTLLLVMSFVVAVAMIGMAVVAVHVTSLPIAILAAGAASLFAAILFVMLAAPDVAMTEAAIGSGLTTFLFFFVLGRIGGGQHD